MLGRLETSIAGVPPFESAKVEVSGASRGEVTVSGSIEGDVSGASSLTVLGNPAGRSVRTSGASKVTY